MRIYRVRIRVAKYYDAVFDFDCSVTATSLMATLAKRLNRDKSIGAEDAQIYLEIVDIEPKEAEDVSDQ